MLIRSHGGMPGSMSSAAVKVNNTVAPIAHRDAGKVISGEEHQTHLLLCVIVKRGTPDSCFVGN